MVTFSEALMNKISKEPGVEEHEQTIVLAISVLIHLKLFSLNLFQVYRRVVIIKELVCLYQKSPFSTLSLSLYTQTHTHAHF